MNGKTRLICLGSLILSVSPALFAQSAGGLTVDVAPCLELRSDLERYDCYERLVAAALAARDSAQRPVAETRPVAPAPTQASPAAPAGRAPAAQAETAPLSAAAETPAARPPAPATRTAADTQTIPPAVDESRFGLPETPAPAAAAEPANELFSTVTELEEITPNRFRITLANGQIWRQTQAKQFRLRVGHEVRIYPSRWGNDFRLSAAALNGFIQVERIR